MKSGSYVAKGPCSAPVAPIIVVVEAPNAANIVGITGVQHRLTGAMLATIALRPTFAPAAAPFKAEKVLRTIESESSRLIDKEAAKAYASRPRAIFGVPKFRVEPAKRYE